MEKWKGKVINCLHFCPKDITMLSFSDVLKRIVSDREIIDLAKAKSTRYNLAITYLGRVRLFRIILTTSFLVELYIGCKLNSISVIENST